MLQELYKKYPLIGQMASGEEVFWLNPNLDNELSAEVGKADIFDAEARLNRFAPYIKKAFPQTEKSGGIIESPLVEISRMRDFLAGEVSSLYDKKSSSTKVDGDWENRKNLTFSRGKLLLKCDNELPISGSIKARGGIYEVLWLAEKLAIQNGMLEPFSENPDADYSKLADDKFRKLFSKYSLAVGSTGNLGLSIGIMSAKLGFRVTVHMSNDAKQWKKDLLRQKGVSVIEYKGDYGKAVEEGRKQSAADPYSHFVDDENSKLLFLGYTTAASRLQKQLIEKEITVDNNHPLFVYLPCGVGGGPGGIAYGLKQIYGKNVHCFFAEPTQAPCMLLGVMTGKHDEISIGDIGLGGKTIADGLAVGTPSRLVGKLVGNLLDGIFTVSDSRLENLTRELFRQEEIFVEPSAAAGFLGYSLLCQNNIFSHQSIDSCQNKVSNQNIDSSRNNIYSNQITKFNQSQLENATHIVWATGGGMVPKTEREKYVAIKLKMNFAKNIR